MSPVRPCLDCGTLSPHSRCPAHSTGDSWNGTRDRAAQRRFRNAVLARDAHRCRYRLENGARCPATRNLQAHHLTPGTWDPAHGITLCREHHRAIDRHAR